jgi:hypothetical protein
LVLAALCGDEAAAEASLVVAAPIEVHAATGGIEAATLALASAVPAEAGPIENRPTLDERQRLCPHRPADRSRLWHRDRQRCRAARTFDPSRVPMVRPG